MGLTRNVLVRASMRVPHTGWKTNKKKRIYMHHNPIFHLFLQSDKKGIHEKHNMLTFMADYNFHVSKIDTNTIAIHVIFVSIRIVFR